MLSASCSAFPCRMNLGCAAKGKLLDKLLPEKLRKQSKGLQGALMLNPMPKGGYRFLFSRGQFAPPDLFLQHRLCAALGKALEVFMKNCAHLCWVSDRRCLGLTCKDTEHPQLQPKSLSSAHVFGQMKHRAWKRTAMGYLGPALQINYYLPSLSMLASHHQTGVITLFLF